MSDITQLSPSLLWTLFDRMTQVPRPSRHEEAILRSFESLCNENGLTHRRDAIGNLIICKPATSGMENRLGVVLQGHVDMVPQKNADSQHDFERDPILTKIEGDWVTAQGTTLGADNGIGVAAALAVLISKDIAHGPLEVLLTIDEESSMAGAFGLKSGDLKGQILLNLDTEDEGELYVGCAGGADVTAKVPMSWQPVAEDDMAIEIAVQGLRGGHSGLDIDKGRGNANKMINRFLMEYADDLDIRAFHFNGGTLRNAIPRESFTQVVVALSSRDALLQALEDFSLVLQNEYGSVEDKLRITTKDIELPEKVYSVESQRRLVHAIAACTSGVTRMSDEFRGVVESSSNLAVVKSHEESIEVLNLVRSLSNTARDDLARSVAATYQLASAQTVIAGYYPGWKPNPDSKILTQMIDGYEKQFGRKPDVKVIHAGLECGLFCEPYPNWDMISFGPTIRHAHSPDEKVHIGSVQKFWDFLVETLRNIPKS